jgi:tetratricopeptide (TPR) repeat protein
LRPPQACSAWSITRRGRYAEAEPLHRRSLGIKERTVGRDDPPVATSLNNLAHLYMRQGRYADAEPVFKRSLAIRESALRRDPSAGTGKTFDDLTAISRDIDRDAVPRALNNLAELYATQSSRTSSSEVGSMERGQVALRDAMVQQNMKLDRHGARLEKIESVWAS